MATKPAPDALMFREAADGKAWDVRCVPEHRMAVFLTAGWTLLLSTSQMRAQDIDDTYRSDLKERL